MKAVKRFFTQVLTAAIATIVIVGTLAIVCGLLTLVVMGGFVTVGIIFDLSLPYKTIAALTLLAVMAAIGILAIKKYSDGKKIIKAQAGNVPQTPSPAQGQEQSQPTPPSNQ